MKSKNAKFSLLVVLTVLSCALAYAIVAQWAVTEDEGESILLSVGMDASVANKVFIESYNNAIDAAEEGGRTVRNAGALAFFSPLTIIWGSAEVGEHENQVSVSRTENFDEREFILSLARRDYIKRDMIITEFEGDETENHEDFLNQLNTAHKPKFIEQVNSFADKMKVKPPEGLFYLLVSGLHMFEFNPNASNNNLENSGYTENILSKYTSTVFFPKKSPLPSELQVSSTNLEGTGRRTNLVSKWTDTYTAKLSGGEGFMHHLFSSKRDGKKTARKELLLISDGKYGLNVDFRSAAPIVSILQENNVGISIMILDVQSSNSEAYDSFKDLLDSNSAYMMLIPSDNKDALSRRNWQGVLLAIMMLDVDSFENRRLSEDINLSFNVKKDEENKRWVISSEVKNESIKNQLNNSLEKLNKMKDVKKTKINITRPYVVDMTMESYEELKKNVAGGARDIIQNNLSGVLHSLVFSIPEIFILHDESSLLSLYLQSDAPYNFLASSTLRIASPSNWKDEMYKIYKDPRFLNAIYDFVDWDYNDDLDYMDAQNVIIKHFGTKISEVGEEFKKGISHVKKDIQNTIQFNKIIYSLKAPILSSPLWCSNLYRQLIDNNGNERRNYKNLISPAVWMGLKEFLGGNVSSEYKPGEIFLARSYENDGTMEFHTVETWASYKRSYEKAMETKPSSVYKTFQDVESNNLNENIDKFGDRYIENLHERIIDEENRKVYSKDANQSTINEINHYLNQYIVGNLIFFIASLFLIGGSAYLWERFRTKAGVVRRAKAWRKVLISLGWGLFFFLLITAHAKPIAFAVHDKSVLADYKHTLNNVDSRHKAKLTESSDGNTDSNEKLQEVLSGYIKELFQSKRDFGDDDKFSIRKLTPLVYLLMLLAVLFIRMGCYDISGNPELNWSNIVIDIIAAICIAIIFIRPALFQGSPFTTNPLGRSIITVLMPAIVLFGFLFLAIRLKRLNSNQRRALLENYYAPRKIMTLQRFLVLLSSFTTVVLATLYLSMLVLYVSPGGEMLSGQGFSLVLSRKYGFIAIQSLYLVVSFAFYLKKKREAKISYIVG